MNLTLKSYCTEKGILLEHSVLHMPEQNSMAKRANQSILDKGRTLLKDAGAPDFLWADAFATTMYAINRTVSSGARNAMPFKAFFQQKPSVSHMRVWYSDVYTHQPKDLRSKKLGE